MRKLFVEPTKTLPKVILDKEDSVFEISGVCIPEDAKGFFQDIYNWLTEYAENPNPSTVIKIDMDYFNSMTAKVLIDLLRKLEAIKLNNPEKEVSVEWHYKDDDEDMFETAKEYESIIKLPFTIIDYH